MSFSLSPNGISSPSSPVTFPKLVEKLLAPSDDTSVNCSRFLDPSKDVNPNQSTAQSQASVSSIESLPTSPVCSSHSIAQETSSHAQFSVATVHPEFPSSVNVTSEDIYSTNLWKRKSPNTDYEVSAVGLENVLTYLIKKTDTLSAKCEEMKSMNDIMHSSLFTTLSNKLNSKFDTFSREVLSKSEGLDNQSTIKQCTDICIALKEDLSKSLDNVLNDNDEMRKVWDSYMNGIRQRVHSAVNDDDDSSSTSEDDDDCDRPVRRSPTDVKINNLLAEIESLKKESYELDTRLIQVEQYSRRESLVFSGFPASIPQKDLELKVLEVMYHLGYQGSSQLTHDDICAVHRLWQPPSSRKPARVIVKFLNRKVVEWALSHKANLANVRQQLGLNLEISESICGMNNESLKICKSLLEEGRITKFYTRNGFPKVVVGEFDAPVKIDHPKVLRDKFGDIPDL